MLTRSVTIVLAAALAVAGQVRRPPVITRPPIDAAKTREARSLLNQAKVSALKIKEEFQRGLIVDEIGATQAKTGDLDGAIDTVNHDYPTASRILEAIGEQLANLNDLPRAKALGGKLREGGVSALLSYMARSQAKAGRITEALQTCAEIPFLEVRSYALEDIAQVQAATGDDAGARRTFALARAAHPKGLLTLDKLEETIAAARLLKDPTRLTELATDTRKPLEERVALLIGVAEELWSRGERTAAANSLQKALALLPSGASYEFFRYFAIPTQVKLGQQDAAMQAAAKLSGEMRVKGFMAVAVTCAELRDIACVDNAMRKMQTALRPDEKTGASDFGVLLMLLNVTAALIDNGQSEAAFRWLATIEGNRAVGSYEFGIAPKAGKQRVLILAQRKGFVEARTLALKIEPDSMTDNYRGTALRLLALLQTKTSGSKAVEAWIRLLRKPEDQAYALLGSAQALIGTEEAKLGYAAIHLH